MNVQQPKDRGILLRDILDGVEDLTSKDKSWALTARYAGACAWNTIERSQKNMCVEPVNTTESGKSQTIKAQSQMTSIANIVKYKSTYGASGVAEPVCVAQRGIYTDTGNRSQKTSASTQQCYEPRQDGKTNTLTTVQKDNAVCEPVRVGSMPRPNGELSQSQGLRVYSADGKSVNLLGNGGGAGAKTGLYAIPVEFENGIPTKAISNSDGKTYTVYRVTNGIIRIKDKEYPIKLQDGFYIIRKLSVSECKRLQTVPEWYEFPVSNAQAYKMLGNGWTVEVIVHLIKACMNSNNTFEPKQLSFFEEI